MQFRVKKSGETQKGQRKPFFTLFMEKKSKKTKSNQWGARNFAMPFYKSKAWKEKSRSYRQAHPFCERCLKLGKYEPSRLVHHKIHINESNWHDYRILFDNNNLEALCMDCHALEHSDHAVKDYDFADDGSIIFLGGDDG